jgi:hypothetical protein
MLLLVIAALVVGTVSLVSHVTDQARRRRFGETGCRHRLTVVEAQPAPMAPLAGFGGELPRTILLWKCERCPHAVATTVSGRWSLAQLQALKP